MSPGARSRLLFGAVAAVVVGAVAVAARGLGDRSDGPPPDADPLATAVVTRGTLVATERVAGTLGYGPVHVVRDRAGAGTVTWLPGLGSTVTRGRPVYRVDNHAVPLLYGGVPPYRALSAGAVGPDAAQLERNLAALGYSGFVVDNRYTTATAAAVRRWQADLDLPRTGRVDPARIVVAAGPIRVSVWRMAPGDPASGPVLGYTGTVRVVSVDLDVGQQILVRPGLATTVTLPDGRSTTGTVADVGRVATVRTTEGGQTGDATIAVTIALPDQGALGTLDSAPVEVALESARAENVLTVPVAALVVPEGTGGYAVEVVSGATTRYMAVRTGLFADGRVEISGPGIAEGTVVGMPS